MKWIFFQVLMKGDKAKHNKQLIKKLWKPWQTMLLFAYFTVEVFLEKYDFQEHVATNGFQSWYSDGSLVRYFVAVI